MSPTYGIKPKVVRLGGSPFYMKLRFFDFAKKISQNSTHKQHKLACVITRKNKVISFGWNQTKTHSKSPHPFKSVHAEVHAILSSEPHLLKNCSVYVYRETRNGLPALARPCTTCMKALTNAGVKEIFYSSETGFKKEKIK